MTDNQKECEVRDLTDPIDYSEIGKNWHCVYPEYCPLDNEEQSPIDLIWQKAIPNNKINFNLMYDHDIKNATLVLDNERSIIRVDYPNEKYNDINVTNHRGEDQIYHLDHMLWHVPSEHTIN